MSARPQKRRRRRFASDSGGATAVEFALASPLMLVLLIGAIQLGWALHCAASVRWALEASSRALLMNPKLSATELQSTMLTRLAGVADTRNLTVTITSQPASRTLVVRSRYAAQLAVPFIRTQSLTFNNAVTVPNLEQAQSAS